MKRVLGSSLAGLALMLCLALPAQAAEIPPTPACEATLKESLGKFFGSPPRNPTRKQLALAERALSEGLAAADCVSDAKPLYKELRPMPFTDQCFESAAKAQAFLGPFTAKYRRLEKPFNRKVVRPFRKRTGVLYNRLFSLSSPKTSDRPRQEARIKRKLNRLNRAHSTRTRAFLKRTQPIWADDAYGIVLSWLELASLRCLPSTLSIDPGSDPAKDPGQRFADKNFSVLSSAIFYVITREIRGASPAGATSSMLRHAGNFDRSRVTGILPSFLTD